MFYTHHYLLHYILAVLMMGISFFNQSSIFWIILLTQDVCDMLIMYINTVWYTFCYLSKDAHHPPLNCVSLLRGLQRVVPEFICIAKCGVESLVLIRY